MKHQHMVRLSLDIPFKQHKHLKMIATKIRNIDERIYLRSVGIKRSC